MANRNHRNATSRPSIYQTVTDRIISSLKAGEIPWEKPWKTPRYAGGPFPCNFYTGKPYRGINSVALVERIQLPVLAYLQAGADIERQRPQRRARNPDCLLQAAS